MARRNAAQKNPSRQPQLRSAGARLTETNPDRNLCPPPPQKRFCTSPKGELSTLPPPSRNNAVAGYSPRRGLIIILSPGTIHSQERFPQRHSFMHMCHTAGTGRGLAYCLSGTSYLYSQSSNRQVIEQNSAAPSVFSPSAKAATVTSRMRMLLSK